MAENVLNPEEFLIRRSFIFLLLDDDSYTLA